MINTARLQKAAEDALRVVFYEKCKRISDIDVCDHTEEIFDNEFEGVAVWCDVNRRALSWFCGDPAFIISYSHDLDEGSIDLFLGDKCTDLDAAMDAADAFNCDRVWHIEQLDDLLMLQATFTLESPDELEAELISKLKALEYVDFVKAIKPVVAYFE